MYILKLYSCIFQNDSDSSRRSRDSPQKQPSSTASPPAPRTPPTTSAPQAAPRLGELHQERRGVSASMSSLTSSTKTPSSADSGLRTGSVASLSSGSKTTVTTIDGKSICIISIKSAHFCFLEKCLHCRKSARSLCL